MLLSLSKISRYEAECASFVAKYGEPFESFRDRVNGMVNEEDFKLEDDLMDWEFARQHSPRRRSSAGLFRGETCRLCGPPASLLAGAVVLQLQPAAPHGSAAP